MAVSRPAKFLLKRNTQGRWTFELVSGSGVALVRSVSDYGRRSHATRTIEQVAKAINAQPHIEEEPNAT